MTNLGFELRSLFSKSIIFQLVVSSAHSLTSQPWPEPGEREERRTNIEERREKRREKKRVRREERRRKKRDDVQSLENLK